MCLTQHSMLAGPVASQVAVLLPKLFPLQHPMLTRQAADALTAMCGSGSVAVSVKALAALLGAVLDAEAAWASRDANAILSLIRLLDSGFSRWGTPSWGAHLLLSAEASGVLASGSSGTLHHPQRGQHGGVVDEGVP